MGPQLIVFSPPSFDFPPSIIYIQKPVHSKFDNFLGDAMIRNIICQPETSVDFDAIMNEGKILIVNLAKGAVGEINSRFLWMLIVSKLQLAAMLRVSIPQH